MQNLESEWAAAIRFDEFLLCPQRKLLLRDEVPVRLGGLAFQLLCLLVRRAGDFVQTREIVRQLWPHGEGTDGALRVHLAALRKALGDGCDGRRYVVNVHSRGYSFVGRLRPGLDSAGVSVPKPPACEGRQSLFGAQSAVAQTVRKLGHRRLVTLVGPAGVGKTAVALAVAQQWAAGGGPGRHTRIVSLRGSRTREDVVSALLQALGINADVTTPVEAICARAFESDEVLLLDGCDRVLVEVADLVERMLATRGMSRVLVTSREPLRVDGECLQRLEPLDTGAGGLLDQREGPAALSLFLARLADAGVTTALAPREQGAAWQICRLLDGLPQSIEAGAALAARIGVLPALSAISGAVCGPADSSGSTDLIDWHWPVDESLAQLSSVEQRVCLRLARFEGIFDISAALAATADLPGVSAYELVEVLMALADKSLVLTHTETDRLSFQLLGTTRSRALRLLCTAEREQGQLCHPPQRRLGAGTAQSGAA